MRALEESAAVARRLASRTTGPMRQKFEEKEETQAQQANMIRRILLGGGVLSRTDAEELGSSARPKRTLE